MKNTNKILFFVAVILGAGYFIYMPSQREIFDLFDNSTVAAVSAVFLGTYFAIGQYRTQKNIDRLNHKKELLTNSLFEITQSLESAIFYHDRIVLTTSDVYKGSSEDRVDFVKILQEVEIPRISHLINEALPLLIIKIQGNIDLYFSDCVEVQERYQEFYNECIIVRKVLFDIKDQSEPFKVKSSQVPGMSMEKVKLKAKKLSSTIDKIKKTSAPSEILNE